MKNNFYYEEHNKYSELIKELKNLPKVDAPDNFEFNLLTRIQNKNFGKIEKQRPQFNFIKFFTPSAAVVVIILLIIIFLPNNDTNYENPLMAEPSVIENKTDKIIGSITNGTIKRNSTNENINETQNSEITKSPKYDIVVNNNDAVVREKIKYPISSQRSIALDDFISGFNAKTSNIKQGNVVKVGEEADEFDGFFFKQEVDKETIEKYRTMMDSVKKARVKADSLKRIKKLE